MSIKANRAAELFQNGYNCAQSVVCAFSEECNIKEEDAFRISEGFGSGITVKEMCGAVSGMTMVIGLTNSIGNLENGESTKASTYADVKKYIENFHRETGSYLCREIKGLETGTPLCSCEQCVRKAAELTEQYLKERNN